MELLNELLEYRFLANTVYDYLVFLLIVAATLVIASVTNRYLKRKLQEWSEKTNTGLDDFIVNRIFPPIVYMIIIAGLSFALDRLKIDASVSLWLDKILLSAGLAVFFLLLVRFVKGLIQGGADTYAARLRLLDPAPEDLDEQLRTVERVKKQVSEIAGMVLAILAILTILSNLGVNLRAIWASLGIGGIALVVAVKDPLTNLVGRMYIYSTGIFDVGHFIVFGQWAGTVKRISIFRTYMELFSDMTTVSIPNADFIKGAVQNYYGRTRFMYKWDLRVPYELPAEDVKKLVIKLRELIHGKPEVNRDSCWIYLERLDRDAKVIRVWFQVMLASWAESLFYGNNVLQDIQLLFESLDIEFALPAQALMIHAAEPERMGENREVPTALPESSE